MHKRHRECASKSLSWVTGKVVHWFFPIYTSRLTSTKAADVWCGTIEEKPLIALSFKVVTDSRKYLKRAEKKSQIK